MPTEQKGAWVRFVIFQMCSTQRSLPSEVPTVRVSVKTPALTASDGRGSVYPYDFRRRQTEPRPAGAVFSDFSHRLVKEGT